MEKQYSITVSGTDSRVEIISFLSHATNDLFTTIAGEDITKATTTVNDANTISITIAPWVKEAPGAVDSAAYPESNVHPVFSNLLSHFAPGAVDGLPMTHQLKNILPDSIRMDSLSDGPAANSKHPMQDTIFNTDGETFVNVNIHEQHNVALPTWEAIINKNGTDTFFKVYHAESEEEVRKLAGNYCIEKGYTII